MLKKLIYLNFIVVILIFIANIASFYAYNFPIPFNFIINFKDYRIEYILIVLLILGLITFLISTLKIKNFDFKNKFLRIFLILNCLFLSFFVFTGISEYFTRRKQLTTLENEYINQAKEDIKNDNITYIHSGGFTILENDEKRIHKIDSVYKKYGLSYFNAGCIVDLMNIKAEKKYEEFVKPYLIKRNGKNWEFNMKSEIKKIKKD